MIRLKRVYEIPAEEDGHRVLVERLWPRGVRREDARIDLWLKDAAPSQELRKWYAHDVSRWDEFRRRYVTELEAAGYGLGDFARRCRRETVTFVFAAKDPDHCSALVLKAFLEGTA